jgi:hypothetical protein
VLPVFGSLGGDGLEGDEAVDGGIVLVEDAVDLEGGVVAVVGDGEVVVGADGEVLPVGG